MAGAIVQVKENSAAASATTITSGTFSVTAGNYLWVCVSRGTSVGTCTVSKNAGTATLGTIVNQGLATEAVIDDTLEHFTCPITGSGTLDMLATFGSAQDQRGIFCVEVSGVNAVDGTDEDTDAGADPTSNSTVNVTVQPAFGLMFGVNYQGATFAPGAGWAQHSTDYWTTVFGSAVLQYLAISATGNVNGNFENDAVDRTNQVMVVFTDGVIPIAATQTEFVEHWGRPRTRYGI